MRTTAELAVHVPDGLPEALKARLLAEAVQHGKAVLIEPVYDTIKLVTDGVVQETLNRDELRWPVGWASVPEHQPPTDPPPADWFVGAHVVMA